MSNILKDNIIIPAWNIIRNDTKIKFIYFLPWLLSIIFFTLLLVYQSIYTYVVIFWQKEKALEIILKIVHSDYLIEILITLWIFLIIYFLLTPIFEWWLIKYIDSKTKDIHLSWSEFFTVWLYKFLPVFEYNNIFSEFKFISILNFYLFTIRFVWLEYIKVTSYIFLAIFILSTILNLLFLFPKYEIVLENKWIFQSIWLSAKMVILNIRIFLKLYFLLFMLNIRIVFNFIIFLSFPIIIVLAIWFITSKFFLILAVIILSILFLFFILLIWYVTAVLEVFTTSIWYFWYIEWKKSLEKIKEN